MRRRTLLNLGLLALVVLLVWLAAVEPGREPPTLPEPLLDLAPAQVDRIRIERPGKAAVALQRRAGTWLIIEPAEAPANTALVEQVLKITASTCPLRYPAAELELARLQLDPPRLRLVLNDQTLDFGGTEALNGHRYLLSGAGVHLCIDRFYPLLTGPPESFMAPRAPAVTGK